MLTGTEAARLIIKNSDLKKVRVQPNGIDFYIGAIKKIKFHTQVPDSGEYVVRYENIKPIHHHYEPGVFYYLHYGTSYIIVTDCEVHIPNNVSGMLVLRSRLTRAGVVGSSAWIDSGYHGKLHMSVYVPDGTVVLPVRLRFAQGVFWRNNDVDNPYNGAWQGDKNAD